MSDIRPTQSIGQDHPYFITWTMYKDLIHWFAHWFVLAHTLPSVTLDSVYKLQGGSIQCRSSIYTGLYWAYLWDTSRDNSLPYFFTEICVPLCNMGMLILPDCLGHFILNRNQAINAIFSAVGHLIMSILSSAVEKKSWRWIPKKKTCFEIQHCFQFCSKQFIFMSIFMLIGCYGYWIPCRGVFKVTSNLN